MPYVYDFHKNLAFGKIAESAITRWLIERGGLVMPVYEVEQDVDKVPRMFRQGESLIAPDLLTIGKTGPILIEAKHKRVFTWHRLTSQWTTGIDLRHYLDYLKVQDAIPFPIWLLFLHCSDQPDGRDRPYCPARCPTGLFGGSLPTLRRCEHHRHANHGKSGMVYWSRESLKLIATRETIFGEQHKE